MVIGDTSKPQVRSTFFDWKIGAKDSMKSSNRCGSRTGRRFNVNFPEASLLAATRSSISRFWRSALLLMASKAGGALAGLHFPAPVRLHHPKIGLMGVFRPCE